MNPKVFMYVLRSIRLYTKFVIIFPIVEQKLSQIIDLWIFKLLISKYELRVTLKL